MSLNKEMFVIRAILALIIAAGIVVTMAVLFPLPDKSLNPACCSADSCAKEGHHK
jgi:hypothetical protein